MSKDSKGGAANGRLGIWRGVGLLESVGALVRAVNAELAEALREVLVPPGSASCLGCEGETEASGQLVSPPSMVLLPETPSVQNNEADKGGDDRGGSQIESLSEALSASEALGEVCWRKRSSDGFTGGARQPASLSWLGVMLTPRDWRWGL